MSPLRQFFHKFDNSIASLYEIKENFFCIEPVTNIGDAYNIKKHSMIYQGLKELKSNKKFEAKVEFRLI